MREKKTNNNSKRQERNAVVILLEIAIPSLLSVVAIVISIFIARNQNKIALFEERYEVFQTYKALSVNAQMADTAFSTQQIDGNSIETWIAYVAHIVPQNTIIKNISKLQDGVSEQEALEVYLQISQEISNCCVQLESAKYIFDLSATEKAEIDNIIDIFATITYEGILSDPYALEIKMKALTQLLVNVSSIETMEEQLSVS